jgi:hypothetical protein
VLPLRRRYDPGCSQGDVLGNNERVSFGYVVTNNVSATACATLSDLDMPEGTHMQVRAAKGVKDEPAAGGESPQGQSVVVSKEELDDFSELRSLLRPSETVRVLDDFARWLFASTAVVGTLAAGFGLSGLDALSQRGRNVFAAAVISVALSLVLATVARIPKRLDVDRFSPESMQDALTEMVVLRGRLLAAAGMLFALALLLAGLAPVL